MIPAYPSPVQADEWAALDRVRGVLLGAAIGDAMGARNHQASGAVAAEPAVGSLPVGGATQLMLLTAEALLEMQQRAAEKGIGPAWDILRYGLERWAFIQGEQVRRWNKPDLGPGRSDGWVVASHALHGRLGGFGAVRQALRTTNDPASAIASRSTVIPHVTGSNGAGGLVRAAPAGMVAEPGLAFVIGAVIAGYSHDGPDGYLAAGALGHIVASLLRGPDLSQAIAAAALELRSWPVSDTVRAAVEESAPRPQESSAARALRIGLHSVVARSDQPVEAIALAAADGGTAAAVVAGAVAGALTGASALPAPWRVGSPAVDVIDALADALALVHRCYVMHRSLVVPAEMEGQVTDSGPAGLYLGLYQWW